MEIRIVTLGHRSTAKLAAAQEIFALYCERIGHSCRCLTENCATEDKFFASLARGTGKPATGNSRTAPAAASPIHIPNLVLLDSRGKTFSSEEFAIWLRRQRDQSTQKIVFAVGPADGWSQAARQRAGLLLSLGPMTLPHELAAAVLAEQIYRAFTIIEGHPYHSGHAR